MLRVGFVIRKVESKKKRKTNITLIRTLESGYQARLKTQKSKGKKKRSGGNHGLPDDTVPCRIREGREGCSKLMQAPIKTETAEETAHAE